MTRRHLNVLLALALIAGAATAPASALPDGLRAPCDSLDRAHCLLPFPNDLFTRADDTTATGRRIDFLPAEMPRSVAGKPIDPSEWNRNDGFSPGSMVLTFVPGLDLHHTWNTKQISTGGLNDPADHIADIGRYAAADAPILLIDKQTGQRWPFWSELDNNAMTKSDERLLILRPAINFLEGHTYLVALRNLRDAQGNVIPASKTFTAQRSGEDPVAEATGRGAHIRSVVSNIAAAEVARGNAFDADDLYLAWDFTIASERNLSERVLHIRDNAMAMLGDTDLDDGVISGTPPSFKITKVTPRTDGARIRVVEGTVSVPNYLNGPAYPLIERDPATNLPFQAVPGTRFLYGPDGFPMQNPAVPTIDIPFVCTLPKPLAAFNDGAAHPILYGHGLLGSRNESTGGSTDRGRERNLMPCAINWMGFAEYDIGGAVATLADPSNMPSMIDRAQQGFLNWVYLARAIVHPNGFAADPAFHVNGQPAFRTGELAYDGNSQGGIMGGALCALSVDLNNCVLGVPGMNYSTLLNRSVDWEGPLLPDSVPSRPQDALPSYSSVLYTMFPDKKEQQVVMALLQMLWDRGEGNGYAQHMTSDPLPNTPPHRVMLHVALGDFQVANVSADVEARTIGARAMDTALAPGRTWETTPFWGLEPMPRASGGAIAPWNGSALVYWDSGNYLPPNANIPPRLDGGDPHEDPRRDPRGGDQKWRFLLTGDVIDVMNGQPYYLCRPGQESQIPRVQSQFGDFDWCK